MENVLCLILLALTGLYWGMFNIYHYGKFKGKVENIPMGISFKIKDGADVDNISQDDITVVKKVFDGIQWIEPDKNYNSTIYDKNCNIVNHTYNFNQMLKTQQIVANAYRFRAICWFLISLCCVFILALI